MTVELYEGGYYWGYLRQDGKTKQRGSMKIWLVRRSPLPAVTGLEARAVGSAKGWHVKFIEFVAGPLEVPPQ